MNYCVNYRPHIPAYDTIDEIIIDFEKCNTSSFIEFVENHLNQRLIISVSNYVNFIDNKEYKVLQAIHEKYIDLDIVIMFSRYDEEYLKKFKEETTISYFYSTRASNWDTFLGLAAIGVSDIYVIEELCFELDKVAEIAHSRNIKIRTYANVCQTSWKETDSLLTFFIRPEDVDFYSQYIDTIEFFGEKEQIPIFYKIYAEDKKWFGPLNEIIIGFNSDLDNKYVIPRFAEKRVSCGKKCVKGGKCKICHRIEELSKVLEQSGLVVMVDKNE